MNKSITTAIATAGVNAKLSSKTRRTTSLLVLLALLVVVAATFVPTAQAAGGECFQETAELRAAVEEYVATNKSETSEVALRYGWPIGTWCVGNLTSFEKVLSTVKLNHEISDWVRIRDVITLHAADYGFPDFTSFD